MDSWGALSADAQSLTGGGGRRCHIARLMDILPDDEARKAVEKAMKNKDLSAAALEKAIAARVGMDKTPSRWSIGNHRRGACNCGRKR